MIEYEARRGGDWQGETEPFENNPILVPLTLLPGGKSKLVRWQTNAIFSGTEVASRMCVSVTELLNDRTRTVGVQGDHKPTIL